jgi:putative ABC transport system substrate-binding protein
MRRRELILLLGGALTVARALHAQQKAMPVVGFLHSALPGPTAPSVAAFRQGLSETDYVEGQNVAIEYRWAEGRYDRLPALAADLVGRKVDVILAAGVAAALAAKNATSTIPIVFTSGGDPVAAGLVGSLARPGGNLTGFSILTGELTPKRLELLSELVPQVGVFALLVNPNYPTADPLIRDVQEAARAKGASPYPEGQHRKRDRRRFRSPPPTARRRARRRHRSVLHQPTRAARGAGRTPCRSGDL